MTTAIDLSRLPPPAVIEVPDPEAIIAQLKAAVLAVAPDLAGVIDLESEPVTKLIEVMAWLSILTRGSINDAARAVMLATSWGSNLDHIAALFGVTRLVVTPADPSAVPPQAAVMEGDEALRKRTQLALEGFSTSGPYDAYRFHALSASGDVLDASVQNPAPGLVLVTVLGRGGDGAPSPALVSTVAGALNAERVRPLCDQVAVEAAGIVPFGVTAVLHPEHGPDPELARVAAEAAVRAMVADAHRLGRAVRLSALFAALHQPGIERVVLTAPAADVICTPGQAPWCTGLSVTLAPLS